MTDRCKGCWGIHDPDPPDTRITFEGYIFRPPFLCICAGKPSARASGRSGGRAVSVIPEPVRHGMTASTRPVAHKHPTWWIGPYSGHEGFVAYAEAVGAVRAQTPNSLGTRIRTRRKEFGPHPNPTRGEETHEGIYQPRGNGIHATVNQEPRMAGSSPQETHGLLLRGGRLTSAGFALAIRIRPMRPRPFVRSNA